MKRMKFGSPTELTERFIENCAGSSAKISLRPESQTINAPADAPINDRAKSHRIRVAQTERRPLGRSWSRFAQEHLVASDASARLER